MATDIIMPQMGESIAEGTITRWIKNVGDTIARDEPLFEISTDKVDAEIPSPAAGVLTEVLVAAGATVPVNTVVGRIGEAGSKPSAAPAAAASSPPAASAEKPGASAPPPAETPAPASAPPAPRPPSPPATPVEDRLRTHSSPLVRRIASDNDVNLGEVEGTGIAGRVTKNDMLSFIDNRKTPPRAAGGPAPASATPVRLDASPSPLITRAEIYRGERDEIVPMTVMRKKIADRMIESRRISAHVSTVFEIDYTGVARLRDKNKESFLQANGTKLTFMPFIFQAITAALKKFPDLNASLDGDDIIYHRDINLGMAVALEWGLIVPVIKNADEKSILGLARAANDLAERARGKKLKPDEVGGGTFTVTNPGVYGSLFGTPIIMQPQVAILGVGTIEKRPVVVTDASGSDSLAIRTLGYLALSFDHRLIDGAVADQFMAFVKRTIEAAGFSLA